MVPPSSRRLVVSSGRNLGANASVILADLGDVPRSGPKKKADLTRLGAEVL